MDKLQEQDRAWIMETQDQTNLFLPCSRQLCSEIRQPRGQEPPNQHNQEVLSNGSGQRSKEIHWAHHSVGLHQ